MNAACIIAAEIFSRVPSLSLLSLCCVPARLTAQRTPRREINAYRPEVYSHNVSGRGKSTQLGRGGEHLSVSQKIAALIARYVIATKFCKDFKPARRKRAIIRAILGRNLRDGNTISPSPFLFIYRERDERRVF